MIKYCEYCKQPFHIQENTWEERKRFCNQSCSAKWRYATYGTAPKSEEARKRSSELLKKRWQEDPELRKMVVNRMTKNNPVYQPGVIEKANKTKLQRGSFHNNFKYGNGKISLYEQKVYGKLIAHGFYYNYPINTKLARDAFPDKHYANAYKPDFVNLISHICIEIDGYGHSLKSDKATDQKKEECLSFLGFKTIRFTHAEIDEGGFDRWLDSYLKNM